MHLYIFFGMFAPRYVQILNVFYQKNVLSFLVHFLNRWSFQIRNKKKSTLH